MSIRNQRSSNIELLRIVAMLLIVASHLSVHGVRHVLDSVGKNEIWADGTIINKCFASLLSPGGEIGVAIFFIISGYFCIKKSSSSILRVMLEVFFYSVLGLFVFFCAAWRGEISVENELAGTAKMLIRSIFVPISGGGYWFVTVYAIIMIFLPLINPFLNQLSKRGFWLFLLFSWFFWYVIASTGSPFFQLQKGLLFYETGAYIQLFNNKTDDKPWRLSLVFIVFLIFGGVLVFCSAVIGTIGELNDIKVKIVLELVKLIEVGIVVPVCAVSLFLCFHSMEMKVSETINTLASTTFGVYLLHDSTVGRELIWNTVFKVDTVLYQSNWFPVLAIVVVFAVFFSCAAFDYIRILYVEPRMVRTANHILDRIKVYVF